MGWVHEFNRTWAHEQAAKQCWNPLLSCVKAGCVFGKEYSTCNGFWEFLPQAACWRQVVR